MKNIVVINQFGEFVQGSGKFVVEYPDATVFPNVSAAKRVIKAMKATKQYIASYYAVENYGFENESKTQIG